MDQEMDEENALEENGQDNKTLLKANRQRAIDKQNKLLLQMAESKQKAMKQQQKSNKRNNLNKRKRKKEEKKRMKEG